MSFIRNTLRKIRRNEEGATAIEYGLIAALIAVVCIGAFQAVGTSISAKMNSVATKVDTAGGGTGTGGGTGS